MLGVAVCAFWGAAWRAAVVKIQVCVAQGRFATSWNEAILLTTGAPPRRYRHRKGAGKANFLHSLLFVSSAREHALTVIAKAAGQGNISRRFARPCDLIVAHRDVLFTEKKLRHRAVEDIRRHSYPSKKLKKGKHKACPLGSACYGNPQSFCFFSLEMTS